MSRIAVALVVLAAACAPGTRDAPTIPGVAAADCTVQAAQAAAPPGMKVGPIGDLNPDLPHVPSGALLVPASGSTPAYCLVTGSVETNPTNGKTANFGLALPLKWNRKFLFSGCGGYCGVVFQTPPDDARGGGFPLDALARGYAIAATDDGHAGKPTGMVFDASWALVSPGVPNQDTLADYYYRAVHVVTGAAKAFVQKWYAGALSRSYFFGCSGGGREAMVEAARFPEDYDGYIAGAPFFDVPGQILAGRAARALLDARDAFIPPALLARVDEAVYAACDATDGVKDNLIQNPGRCAFDPGRLRCKGRGNTDCLTQNQVRTLHAWFSAAKDRRGRVASFGFPVSDLYNGGAPGANLFGWTQAAGPPHDLRSADPWGKDILKQPAGWLFYDQSFKHLVHRDPAFDNNRNSAVDRQGVVNEAALRRLEQRTREGRADDPRDLDFFTAANRRLILFHGYSDGFVNPFRTVRFYEDWAKLAGGYEVLGRNARLFMVPGMYHCSKGPGPNFFDALGALEQWVESGVAPESILATKHANDERTQPVQRTMPLCPFPTQARYSGSGELNRAANWSCARNDELLKAGPNGKAAGLGARYRGR